MNLKNKVRVIISIGIYLSLIAGIVLGHHCYLSKNEKEILPGPYEQQNLEEKKMI